MKTQTDLSKYETEVGKGRFIADTINLGDKINYIYDFGTSTELTIEVLKHSDFPLSNNPKIELVARNYLPLSNCVKCGQQATQVCTICAEEEMTFICDKCAEKYHNEENENEEHYLLSLENSPRCDVCGYEPVEPSEKLFDEIGKIVLVASRSAVSLRKNSNYISKVALRQAQGRRASAPHPLAAPSLPLGLRPRLFFARAIFSPFGRDKRSISLILLPFPKGVLPRF